MVGVRGRRGRLELAPARRRRGCWWAQGEEVAAELGLRERDARVGEGPVRPIEIDSQPNPFPIQSAGI